MSHLKKLSDKLGRKFLPQILPLATIENIHENKLEEYSHKILNLNKKVTEYLIPSLKLTASHHKVCSLSCNNVNINHAAFVIHNNLEPNKWTDYQATPQDYSAYLNPSVLSAEDPIFEEFEFCPSLPFLKAKVQRHSKIQVEYMTTEGEYIQEQLEGFKARVFMHEFDHLEAILMSSFNVNSMNLQSTDPETHEEIEQVLKKFKDKVEFFVNILEDRYLSDPQFKKQADEFGNKREFFIDHIVDDQFDADMHLELMQAVIFQQNTKVNNGLHQLSYIFESPPYIFPLHDSTSKAYMVNSAWWQQWKSFAGYETTSGGPKPGMITNYSINLQDSASYILVSKNTWRRLRNWYTADRKRVVFILNCMPDLSAIDTIVSAVDLGSKRISAPLWYTLDQYKRRVQKKFKVLNNSCNFFLKFDNGNEKELEDDKKSLNELEFYEEIKVGLRVRGYVENKTVRFELERYDEDAELKKALEISMQSENVKGVEVDKEKVEDVRGMLREGKERVKLVFLPLRTLKENVRGILEVVSLK